MKTRLLIAIAVCLIVASGAWAQFPGASQLSPRTLGMSAGIAVVDDAAAWSINPAALATLRNCTPREGQDYASDILGTWGSDDDDNDNLSLSWSGWYAPDKIGLGVGTFDQRGHFKMFGAGVGKRFGDSPLTWGVNFEYFNGMGTSETLFNAALNYDWSCGVRTGLVVEDVLGHEDNSPLFDLGIAKSFGRLLLAADVLDITDEYDTTISGGAEYTLTDAFKLRAGAFDNGDGHDLSLGLGYAVGSWRIDAAYRDADEQPWTVGVGHTF